MADFEYPIACLRGAWSFVLGSLRLILFVAAILYLLVHLCIGAILVFLDKPLLSTDLQGHAGFFDYCLVIILVAVAGLGVYGSFYKHIISIRAFAIITSLIGLFFLLSAAVQSEPSTELDQMFNESMRYYDWHAKPNKPDGPESNETNTYVDGFQLMGCCGYINSRDWDQYRPSDGIPESLPLTCCATISPPTFQEQCLQTQAKYRPGCKQLLTAFYEASMVLFIFYGFYQIFMALIAFIVSFCNLADLEQNFPRSGQQNDYACNNIIIEAGPARHTHGFAGYMPANQGPISTISRSESKIGLVQASGDLMGSERPSAPSPPPKYPNLL